MGSVKSNNLNLLADQLWEQRESILADWLATSKAANDPSASSNLSRSEFYDHIPEFLERLCASFRGKDLDAAEEPAQQHGAHRWQQGLPIEWVVREWALLHRVLMSHMGALWEPAGLDIGSFQRAYRILAEAIETGVGGSMSEFHSRMRVQAEARMRDLEAALEKRDERAHITGQNLQEASHDLRGSLQSIRLSTFILKRRTLDDETDKLVSRISDASDTLYRMLTDLLDLARLEAGYDARHVTGFNAATILQSLCNTMRDAADSKGLILRTRGPDILRVRGDAMKVQRIAQNLILNALKYTSEGEVVIEWKRVSPERWSFKVQDTGPGLEVSSSAHYAASLEDAANEGDESKKNVGHTLDQPSYASATIASHGEGIGLAIVHRLCDLLDAVLKVESEPDRGSTFEIMLPTNYRTFPES